MAGGRGRGLPSLPPLPAAADTTTVHRHYCQRGVHMCGWVALQGVMGVGIKYKWETHERHLQRSRLPGLPAERASL